MHRFPTLFIIGPVEVSNCSDVIMKKLNVPVSASDPVHKLPGVHRAPGRPGQP